MKRIIILGIVSLSLLAARTNHAIQKPVIRDNEPTERHYCYYHPGACSIFGVPKTPAPPPPPRSR